MTSISFFGKLLIDARGAAHREVPRELTWSTYDIAKAIETGELILLDPTERVTEQWGNQRVNLAQAYANRMEEIMPRERYGWAKLGAPIPSKIEQDFLLRLANEGQLEEQDFEPLAVRALRCGAGDAFLVLTANWAPEKRLHMVRSEVTGVGEGFVPLIHACVFMKLHQVVRAMIQDGLKGDEITSGGQGFGHYLVDTDILPDLKAAGLDPDHTDHKSRAAKSYWSEIKLPGAKQKELTKTWDRLFSEQVDPEQAKKVLLFELERKPKTLVAQQCKDAKIKPGDLVDGRYLVEHATRSLILVDSMIYLKTDSGAKWLMEHVPKEHRPEQRWLRSLAHGLSSSRAYDDDAEWDLCRVNSALMQMERLDRVHADIERLSDPDDHLLAWNKVYHGVRGEGVTRKPQHELFVDDPHWRAWWMQPDAQDVPRILSLYESPMRQLLTSMSDTDIWKVAHAFFQDLSKNTPEEQSDFLDALPAHPTLGMGAWFTFSMASMYTHTGSNRHKVENQHFPAEFVGLHGVWNTALVADRLWGRGVRPNAEQSAYLIDLIANNKRCSSTNAGAVLQAHLLTLQTPNTQGAAGGRRL